jgi:cytochrome c biogenesis protein CcmG, thiol:disulfide interchange protein DsbE
MPKNENPDAHVEFLQEISVCRPCAILLEEHRCFVGPPGPVQPTPSAHSSASSIAGSSPWVARAVALAVGVAVVSFLALMIWGLGRRSAGTVGEARIATRPAPSFTLPLFGGESFSLAEQRGKPMVVNFWASWCVPCEDEAAALVRSAKRYAGRATFVGVAVQDTDRNAREFVRRFGVTYPNGLDASGEIAVDFGMTGVPETYFIEPSGRIVRKWQGPLDDALIERFLAELVS